MRDSSAQGLIAWKERLAHLSMSGDAAILLLYSVAICVIAGVERFIVGASLDGLVDFNAGEILAICAIYSVVTAKTAEHHALPRRSRGHLSLRAAPAAARVAAFRFPSGPASPGSTLCSATRASRRFRRWVGSGSRSPSTSPSVSSSSNSSRGRGFKRRFFSRRGSVRFWVFRSRRDGIRLVSPNGWFIYILESCSAFSNISLAILLWLSLLTLAGAEIHRRQLVALGVAALSIFLLNALRIVLMTPSQPAWYFWHEGTGALIFSGVTFVAVALPTALSLRPRA